MMIRTAARKEFELEYSRTMTAYLESGGELPLHQAYELGRRALNEGLTLLDIPRLHSEVLFNVLQKSPRERHEKSTSDAASFLSEFLSPFEMTFRSFLDTVASLKTEIMERQNAESALEQSERYYKALIENALDVVTILDGSGTVMYSSPSGERVLGYSQSDIEGRNVFEFVHPDDVGTILDIFASGKAIRQSTARAEFRFRHKNGEWLNMESIGRNLLDDPSINGIIVNSRDITERKNLEQIRRKYEFIANASRDLMTMVNTRYEFEAVNEAWCTALSMSREDILGRNIDKVILEDHFRDLLSQHIGNSLSGTEVKDECWLDFPGLGKRYLEIDCYPYFNEVSHVTHAIAILRDATGRKKAEENIRESQRQRAEVITRYARLIQQAQEDERRRISRELHDEIGQRLTALNLRLDAFEESLSSDQSISIKKLVSVKKEVSNLFREIRRISHNLRPSALDHFGLATALKYLCKEYKKINSMTVGFHTNISDGERYNSDVEIALYRVAQEALSNCVKHASVKQAELRISQEDGSLKLTISDNGNGFDPLELRARYEGEEHFGLMNMRERIELSGGSFSIVSNKGKGTTISASVPVVKKNEE